MSEEVKTEAETTTTPVKPSPTFREVYPLLEPYSYAAISKDPNTQLLQYVVIEPTLLENEKAQLERVREILIEELDIDLKAIETREGAEKYLKDKINWIVKKYRIKIEKEPLEKLAYYTTRDFLYFGKIDPLMRDHLIEDISCDGVGVPIYIWHREYESMPTTIGFNDAEELDDFIIKLAHKSGRHISIAQPVLDAGLPDGSRIQLTFGREVTRKGSTFTIRKFRADPLTISDLLTFYTMSSEMAAYLWYAIENRHSVMVAGGIASGKSVPYDERILVSQDGLLKFVEIGKLTDEIVSTHGAEPIGNFELARCEGLYVPCFDSNLRVRLSKVSACVRHKAPNTLYRIKTRSGREVTTTADHSVFTISDGIVRPIAVRDLNAGDFLAIPRRVPVSQVNRNFLNFLIELGEEDYGLYVRDVLDYVKVACEKIGRKKTAEILGMKIKSLKEALRKRPLSIRASKFLALVREADIKFDANSLFIGSKTSRKGQIPAMIPLNEEFLRLIGHWVAEGYYNPKVTISSLNEELRRDILQICQRCLGVLPSFHKQDPTRLDIGSKALRVLFERVLGLASGSNKKRIPSLVFTLPRKKMAAFLKAYFEGDGYLANYVEAVTKSQQLANDLLYILLYFEIVASVREKIVDGETYYAVTISSAKNMRRFLEKIGFVRQERYRKVKTYFKGLAKRHTNVDIVPEIASLMKNAIKGDQNFRRLHNKYNSYLTRRENPSQETLVSFLRRINQLKNPETLRMLADADIFWDEVKSIEPIRYDRPYVYDLEVNPTQNFIGGFGGIFLHNTTLLNCLSMFIRPEMKIVSIEDTPELNIPHENWIQSVSRTGFGPTPGERGAGEISLFELLKTAMRQRPDYIIVGEIRGAEAYTLFQGMATGHLGMCTIHAESVPAIIHRLESEPMNVARTLLTTIDIITIQTRTRIADLPVRRTMQISEMIGLDPHSKELLTNDAFKWDAKADKFNFSGRSYLLEKISRSLGIEMKEVQNEIGRRKTVLEWMAKQGIRRYKEVAGVIRQYYAAPDKVFERARMGVM